MIVKIFGAGDLIAALLIFLLHFEIGNWKTAFIVFAYLAGKGAAYYQDVQSWADIFIGVYVWIIFFGFTTWIDFLLIIYILQKGITSFF